MTEQFNEKLLKHEFRLNNHDKDIATMRLERKHDSDTLDSINKQLSTIKTAIITAIIILVAGSIGVIDTIKALL